MKTYPLVDKIPNIKPQEQLSFRAVLTGEFRPPKKGEWYLSGAIPGAYQAPNDLNDSYHILRIMKMEQRTTYVPAR